MTASKKNLSWLVNVCVLLVTLVLCEIFAGVLFATKLQSFEKVRLMARSEAPPPPSYQTVIGQANLSYISAPQYQNDYGPQHNTQGYRGKAVSLRKLPEVFRILCLGGSTVYGWAAKRAEDAYPPQMEKLLNEKLPAGIKKVEVINAGLPHATSAEMLTHYHFKYRYYRPDLVIIEAGGNDAEALAAGFYHPDYSHWRQPLQLPQQPAVFTRKLMKSRLVSLFLVPLIYGRHPYQNNLTREIPSKPIARWYEPPPGNFQFGVPEDEMGMKRDLETLITEIQKDGAKILLIPFRSVSEEVYEKPMREAVALNEKIIRELAESFKLPFASFPRETISAQNWTDDCHLNEAGEKEKALYVAAYVQNLMK